MWNLTALDGLKSTRNLDVAEKTGLKPEQLGGLWMDKE